MHRMLARHHRPYGWVRKISPPPGFDPLTAQVVAGQHNDYATRPTMRYGIEEKFVQDLADRFEERKRLDTLGEKRTGINSSLSYRYKAESCGLDLSASCEHGNELSVGCLL
jgi:hypothetical protein